MKRMRVVHSYNAKDCTYIQYLNLKHLSNLYCDMAGVLIARLLFSSKSLRFVSLNQGACFSGRFYLLVGNE